MRTHRYLARGFGWLIACALALSAGRAWAGPLGGFSADEAHYLVGRDTICTPLEPDAQRALAAPQCQSADASAVAAMKFRRGALQRGKDAVFVAVARGRELTVSQKSGAVEERVAVFQSMDPIARVVSVHASPNARLVAVEYEVRFGGRSRVEVVGLIVPGAGAASTGEPAPVDRAAAPAKGAAPSATPAPPTELPKAARAALDKARRAAKRRRHANAAKAYQEVLAADADHAEARFGLARALAGQGKLDHAVRELEVLAASQRDDAPRWRVQARFDKVFAKLRGQARFRRATGLDPTPGRTPTLYERLLGFSDTWEQPETTCEKPEVGLAMDRQAQTFRLRITSRCGGYEDTLRLRGELRLIGADQVRLVLPNKGAKDESVACVMKVCSGEDCLQCAVDVDLEFVLRPTRR